MRFHMGVSFRFSTLKKILIPFLLGVLAYFGVSYLNLLNVYALESSEVIVNDDPFDDSSDVFYDDLLDYDPYDYNLYSSDESFELKGLSKYVFWFFAPYNTNDLLCNLYVIFFLYVVGYFTLKFTTIIHNTKWRRRR